MGEGPFGMTRGCGVVMMCMQEPLQGSVTVCFKNTRLQPSPSPLPPHIAPQGIPQRPLLLYLARKYAAWMRRMLRAGEATPAVLPTLLGLGVALGSTADVLLVARALVDMGIGMGPGRRRENATAADPDSATCMLQRMWGPVESLAAHMYEPSWEELLHVMT